jgi:hypothetical protein
MNLHNYSLCLAAHELRLLHGVFFAAAFLADNDVPVDQALVALCRGGWVAEPKAMEGTLTECDNLSQLLLFRPRLAALAIAPLDDDTVMN